MRAIIIAKQLHYSIIKNLYLSQHLANSVATIEPHEATGSRSVEANTKKN